MCVDLKVLIEWCINMNQVLKWRLITMDVYVVLFRLRSLNVTDIVDRVAGMVNSFSVGECRFIAIDSKCSLSVGKNDIWQRKRIIDVGSLALPQRIAYIHYLWSASVAFCNIEPSSTVNSQRKSLTINLHWTDNTSRYRCGLVSKLWQKPMST